VAKVRALILTEGGKKIGFGHVTRCVALREALRSKGISATLVVNGDSTVEKQFRGKLDRVLNWLCARKKTDELLKRTDIAIVDSYLAPIEFYRNVSESVAVPVYLDDFSRLSYPAGVVVNGTVDAEKISYPEGRGVRYLLGSQYALLRKNFWIVPAKHVRRTIQDVLITFGGIERGVLAEKLLAHLLPVFPDWKYHIVLPRQSRNPNAMDRRCRFYFGISASRMRCLMMRCDIAISGGGQTINELSVCGLPTIGICLAENQKVNLRGWQKRGALRCAGFYDDSALLERIAGILKRFDYPARCRMSLAGRESIDGQGALNLAEVLKQQIFRLESANSRHCRTVFNWFNEAAVRKVSFKPDRVSWADHRAWFHRKLADHDCIYEIVTQEGAPIGQVRFDLKGSEATVSISIIPALRGKGLGATILRFASLKLFASGSVKRIHAYIKSWNRLSFKAFKNAGYQFVKTVTIKGTRSSHLVMRRYEKQ